MKARQPESVTHEKKYKWCERILVLTMIVLFMRLFDLQILRGEEMKDSPSKTGCASRKSWRRGGLSSTEPGKILANTRPSFNLYLIPEDIKDFSQTVDGLVELLDIDREEIIEKLKDARDFPSSFP